MKLPFELGVKLIFRLLLPGFLLTLGLYPLWETINDQSQWGLGPEYIFIISTICTGWIIVILDQPIYIALEGRRYWPELLRRLFLYSEQRRLDRLVLKFNKYYALSEVEAGRLRKNAAQKYTEATVELRKFPLDDNGLPEVNCPTRLGNLIEAFESYPTKRYGINAIFFWYRIWLLIDKDLREELDNRQAVADSAIYGSVSLFISSLLWAGYSMFSKQQPLATHLPGFVPTWVPAIAFLLASWLFYRASLTAQYQFGETFKSLFDLHVDKLQIAGVLDRVANITHDSNLSNQDRGDQLRIAARYLHNYKVRCPRTACESFLPLTPQKYAEHVKAHHSTGDKDIKKLSKEAEATTLKENDRKERRTRIVKSVAVLLSLLLIAAGYFLDRRLVYISFLILLLAWVHEALIRRRQEQTLKNLDDWEKRNGLPRTVGDLPRFFALRVNLIAYGAASLLGALVLLKK